MVMRVRVQYQDELWEMAYGTLLGIILSVVSGVCLWVSFPPTGWWMLAWVALVPMAVAQYVCFPHFLAFFAPLITFRVFIAGYFREVVRASSVNHSRPVFLALAAVFIGTACERSFHERTRYEWFLVEPVCFWVAFEWVRDQLRSVGTWASLAYSQYNVNPVVRSASIAGTFGVSAVIILVNYGFAWVVIGIKKGRSQKDIVRKILWAAVVFSAVLAAGWWKVDFTPQSARRSRVRGDAGEYSAGGDNGFVSVRVAACQPGGKYTAREDQGVSIYEEMVAKASREGSSLFVLPEGCFSKDPRDEPVRSSLISLARRYHIAIVAPFILDTPEGTINEAVFITSGGEIAGSSPKHHPLSIYGETSLTQGSYRVYDAPWGKVGIMICFDLDFTGVTRALAEMGANLIAVPSSDWQSVASKHYTHAVFRAAENGVAIVKADAWYSSCAVSWNGRVEAKTVSRVRRQELLIADVMVRTGPAFPGGKVGYCTGLLCVIGLISFRMYDLVGLSRRLSPRHEERKAGEPLGQRPGGNRATRAGVS